MAVPPPPTWEAQLVRALYAYLSSGENQLSFHEGDLIALIGERNKGWQFGENLRTQCSGWFPLAYTENLVDDSLRYIGVYRHCAINLITVPGVQINRARDCFSKTIHSIASGKKCVC